MQQLGSRFIEDMTALIELVVLFIEKFVIVAGKDFLPGKTLYLLACVIECGLHPFARGA